MAAKTPSTSSRVTCISRYPNSRMPRSNSVSGGLFVSACDTLPNYVDLLVSTATAVAAPLATLVSKKRLSIRFKSGVSICKVTADFYAGNVSPVSAASLTKRSLPSKIKQSVGIMSLA